tara:strand:- start:151 stop:1242 length:1092 start_codon:yes stop_codon:yes gene_type:complete
MDVLTYSALNEQASLKKQVAAKQKELFDLKANAGSGGSGAADAEDASKAWLCGDASIERYLQICPEDTSKWGCIHEGSGWTGDLKVANEDGYYRCGCNCTWTVPSGATKARFQLWGAGGGANHPSRCCGITPFGATGAYLSVIIPVTSGQSYTLCAGCAYCCYGYPQSGSPRNAGCPSYVQGPGLCYVCAQGGSGSLGIFMGARYGYCYNCAPPCLNGSDMNYFSCHEGGTWCRNSGCTGGFWDYVSDANYFGTTNIATPTGENVIYGLRGMFQKWCVHSNNYGCFWHPPVKGYETNTSGSNNPNQKQSFDNGTTCCGKGFDAWTGDRLRLHGAGGYMSVAMGGCQDHCGSSGKYGMVCVQWQ